MKVFCARIITVVVHNDYYLLALLLIHSLITSLCVCKNIYTCFLSLSMTGAAGPMTRTFPSPHCGRNTHFRQICFVVPNFNFIYIYIFINIYIYINQKNYVTTDIFFKEIRKNWQSEKIEQMKRTNAPYLMLFFKWKH